MKQVLAFLFLASACGTADTADNAAKTTTDMGTGTTTGALPETVPSASTDTPTSTATATAVEKNPCDFVFEGTAEEKEWGLENCHTSWAEKLKASNQAEEDRLEAKKQADAEASEAKAKIEAHTLYVTNIMYSIKRGDSIKTMIPEARELLLTIGVCSGVSDLTNSYTCTVKEGDTIDFYVEFTKDGSVKGVRDVLAKKWTQE